MRAFDGVAGIDDERCADVEADAGPAAAAEALSVGADGDIFSEGGCKE